MIDIIVCTDCYTFYSQHADGSEFSEDIFTLGEYPGRRALNPAIILPGPAFLRV